MSGLDHPAMFLKQYYDSRYLVSLPYDFVIVNLEDNTGYIRDTAKDDVMEENTGGKAVDIIIQSFTDPIHITLHYLKA